ncbi:ABC transporter permease [Paraliobacillus sp. JSM ZJ581]|uniref:ABC transporter permease n=1 Tax=Paraliobacillus sp. JSM ZJ581 TaxID=3342118 RepID=UPI0035A92F3F
MKKYFYSTMLICLMLVVWEVVARIVAVSFILPSPIQIIEKLFVLKGPLLKEHLPVTLTVIGIGLTISLLLGIAVAMMMHGSKLIEQAIYPLLITSQTIPIIALAPIFVLWFGYTIWSKVVVTILITFFPIAIGTFDGLRSTDKDFKELFQTFGLTNHQIFLKLEVPSALPSFFSGLKVAVPMSVIGAAIGEWLGAQSGLGYFSRRMMTQFDGAGVFAPIVLLSLIGIALFMIVLIIEKFFLKWRNI